MSSRRARVTVTAALTLAVATAWGGTMARKVGAEPTTITGATFEWSVNDEANTGAFNGDCNFMSAGESDGSAASYRATDGSATVLKRDASGQHVPISAYSTRCLDADGVKVTAGGPRRLGQKVRYTGGTGTADPVTGEVSIQWTGTFSNNFYGHLVPFWFEDPLLTVGADGTGTVTATVGGYSSSIENPDLRELADPIPGVVIATLQGVDSANPNGFVVAPDYAGVEISGLDAPQNRVMAGWGSWPTSLVSAMNQLGSAGYWYSTGGAADARKAPAPIVVGFGEGTAPTTTTTAAPPTTESPATTTTVPVTTESVPAASPTVASPTVASPTQPPAFVATVGETSAQGSGSATSVTRSSGSTHSSTATTGTALASTSASASGGGVSPVPAANTFSWTVDAGSSGVTLDAAAGAAGEVRFGGELGAVTVVDTRDGAPAWSISGQVSDAGGGVSGAHLGWTPFVRTGGGGVSPGAPVVLGATAGAGLSDPAVLASAPKGHAGGTATVGAALDLRLPATLSTGTYRATLTITALG